EARRCLYHEYREVPAAKQSGSVARGEKGLLAVFTEPARSNSAQSSGDTRAAQYELLLAGPANQPGSRAAQAGAFEFKRELQRHVPGGNFTPVSPCGGFI